MLDTLRRGATGWVAKLFLSLLVVSFAVWGVADVFRGYGQDTIAKVGGTEITIPQLQKAFQDEIAEISAQAGQRISNDQARALGLDSRAISRLVSTTVVEQHAKELGLGISDEAIIAALKRDPAFKGADGKFNRVAFDSVLRQNGLSEQGYLAVRRREDVRRQLAGSLIAGAQAPAVLVEALHAHKEETRVIEHVTIDAEKAVGVPEPDEAKLKETYEQNKSKFMTEEFRHLAVLLLTLEDAKKLVTVSDDDLKASYERTKDSFDTPERRRVQQISFKDKAAAEEAKKSIAGGKSFAEVATAAGAKQTDIDLGLMSRKDFIDSKIADAVFALAKDAVSDVVEGRFATVIVKVTEIQAGKKRTFEDVKEEIRGRLLKERAAPEIQKLHDVVDDNRAAGKTLKEIAATAKLTFLDVPALDKNNQTPEKQPGISHPEALQIVKAAFEGKSGVESESLELKDGGYAWVDVLGTKAAAQRPFEDVKSEVKTFHIESERRKGVSELAAKLVERLKKGEAFAAIATEAGGKLETTSAVKRDEAVASLSKNALDLAFSLAKGGAASAPATDNKSRVLVRVAEIKAASAPTPDQTKAIRAEVERDLQADVLAAYVDALRERLGVTINEKAAKRALGTDQAQ